MEIKWNNSCLVSQIILYIFRMARHPLINFVLMHAGKSFGRWCLDWLVVIYQKHISLSALSDTIQCRFLTTKLWSIIICVVHHTENESWRVITHGKEVARSLATHPYTPRTGDCFSCECWFIYRLTGSLEREYWRHYCSQLFWLVIFQHFISTVYVGDTVA
jgi:hypothetical protein